jgi:hypothetical protein
LEELTIFFKKSIFFKKFILTLELFFIKKKKKKKKRKRKGKPRIQGVARHPLAGPGVVAPHPVDLGVAPLQF